MNLETKFAALAEIYRIYEKLIDGYKLACEKGCGSCCTCNVSVTTLEAYFLFVNLSAAKDRRLWQIQFSNRLKNAPEKRFQPTLTFNRIAALCSRGEEIPEEQCDPSWGRCPFLDNEQCAFYEYRPFGCRCMSSLVKCSERGFAEMPPLVLSANDVFMQCIEHIDADGYSGNLIDVLTWMNDESNRHRYENGAQICNAKSLVANIPIPALMIPPEHRIKIEPILKSLRKVCLKYQQSKCERKRHGSFIA